MSEIIRTKGLVSIEGNRMDLSGLEGIDCAGCRGLGKGVDCWRHEEAANAIVISQRKLDMEVWIAISRSWQCNPKVEKK